MTIRSPFDGVVIEKDAVEGQQIAAGARIYRLADLSRVWVIVWSVAGFAALVARGGWIPRER